MEAKTVYFDSPGEANTEATLRLARQRAEELGIKTILVASTKGDTAVRAAEFFKEMKVLAVSHVAGFRGPDTQEFTEVNKAALESKGGLLLTATHAFGGIDRALQNKYDDTGPSHIIAGTLRIFGQGMKVACEICLMAADAGLVRTDEDVIAIGGTVYGADTAIVLKPVNSIDFFEIKVREILCKPRF